LQTSEEREADDAQSGFRYRGVVEGYYGRPYPHAERLALIERMSRWGMNLYVYAPKDDALGREQWRTRYGDAALDEFRELVSHGAGLGVDVGFTLSPGLSIEYANAADIGRLIEKFRSFEELGAQFLCLALDDVPSELTHPRDRERFDSLAAAHVSLGNAVRSALGFETTLWLVPTDYAGQDDSAYLVELGSGLAPAIEVGWTGRTVVSPDIRAQEAEHRAALLCRRPLVWDNVPVNDGPMRTVLHLGPYSGRDPDLVESLSGVLLNPMEHARASSIMLQTAADYLRDPYGYDAEASWQSALNEAAQGAVEAATVFAAAHRFSALAPHDRDRELEAAFHAVRQANAGEHGAALAHMRVLIDERIAAADALRDGLVDRTLYAEIEPWVRAHHAESEAIGAALDLLEAVAMDAPAMDKSLALLRMQGRLTRLAASRLVSYGPRRAVYPQFVCLEDEGARFGRDPVLFLDACLSEEIVRYAERRALDELASAPAP